jgi:hypothetical protein
VAIAGIDTWLLIEAESTSELVVRCWEVLRRRGELNEALTALASDGLDALGSFALVARGEYSTRVIVRGDARVDVRSATEGNLNLGSDDALSWSEHLVAGPVEVRLLGGALAGDGLMPLTGGVTLASMISLGSTSSAPWEAMPVAAPPVAEPPRAAVAEPGPQAAVAEPEAARRVAASAPETPAPTPIEAPAADAGQSEVPSFDHLFGATIKPIVEEAKFAPPVIVQSPAEGAPKIFVEQSPSAETLDPSNTDYPINSAGLIDSFPWADASAEADAALPSPPVAPADSLPVVPASAPSEASPPPPPVAPGFDAGPAIEPTPSPDAVASDVEFAAATINRSALLAAMGSTPSVLSARCPDGHLGPPYATQCWICQQRMAHEEPFMAPRPVLGMLRFSTGDVVPLDRGVLAGRAPAAPDVSDRERPHVLALASPQDGLSRSHLEVRLDGWHVMVIDLGSTNGTLVTPPGQDAFRLRKGDPVVIEPGTEVNLAEVVTFTYEAR